ncbi:MAG: glycosyltransferase family 1 protein [Actinomycetaceae bacterium]|nr:glycosyltransferase family 1 protein [Arcanobacterium sp.]MDD7687390.1 glycosyltransferase family 1 protein [Actinomycetaceae bacterium]MDY5272865.1 glycosyltransferase family 1 protein [Arcanobacterium sp.]
MRLAIKRDKAVVDADGRVAGHSAGDTLLRRILRLYPGATLIGAQVRKGDGFDVAPLEFLDPHETAVLNMDVIDSSRVWQKMYALGAEHPKVMNFVWRSPNRFAAEEALASVALSVALFPTFANSERTASEIRELAERWTVSQLYNKMRLSYVNLGFRLAHVQERHEPDVPIVLYPAIYLSAVKRPELFLDVCEWVHKRTPITVEMRLHENHLVSEAAMKFSHKDWVWVGPLTATRDSYWNALSRTTAFLATCCEESYGIEYVEALGAGVVGIFPDLPWARALVPPEYPFFYSTQEEAQKMLWRAVVDTAACRDELDACAGGSLQRWIGEHHSDDAFDERLTEKVQQWLGVTA